MTGASRGLRNGVLFSALAAAAAIACPGVAMAQNAPSEAVPGQPGTITPQTSKPANTLNVHGTVQGTLTTDYISRGVLLENQGLIFQPQAELAFTLFDNPDAPSFGKGTFIVGIWNSIHSNHEFAGSVGGQGETTMSAWYEFDWYVGFGLNLTPELALTAVYQEFLSPSDAFGTAKNIEVKFTYNDAKVWEKGALWEGFSLQPYVKGFYEVDGKAGTGAEEGFYVEVGVTPAYTIAPKSDLPITIGFPIFAGFGFEEFYASANEEDELFGFVAGGVTATVPLNFLTERGWGEWKYTVGGYYYYFGDGTEDFNAGAGGGDNSEWVATTGFSLSF